MILLVGDDDVDVVLGTEAVIAYREQTICIRWQVDTHHLGGLVGNYIEEAWILV
jgi:hypothetical protein